MKTPNELISAAQAMYIRGSYSVKEIAAHCNVTERAVYNWIDQKGWKELKIDLTAEQIVLTRLLKLTDIDNKNEQQLKEYLGLVKTVGEFQISAAKAEKIRAEARRIDTQTQQKADQGTQGDSGNKKRGKAKPTKNDISHIDASTLSEFAQKHFFEYQLCWRENKIQRNRFILKPRQIGATYFFAFEAFEDAIVNGKNQIFLSASKAQARVFKAYIIAFAQEHCDIELKGGDEIALYKDGKIWATLYFLSTNASTAQSYHGNLYIDEAFWINNYKKLEMLAKPMASQKGYRRTTFSTPSSIQHPAYSQWTGERYNKGRKLKHNFDLRPESLLKGVLGADRVWRYALNIEDAERMGCDLFDIQELRDENTTEAFDNLFMLKFIDDLQSVFPFSELQPCLVDSSAWLHLKRDSDRPLGNHPVAIGYDPSRVRDNAALSVLRMPITPRDKWQLVEIEQYKNQACEYQGNRIKEFYQRYNVAHLGIDCSGVGYGVYDQIMNMPGVMPITYGIEVKTQLVMTTKQIIQGKRLQYDASHKTITSSFMQITQQTTPGGSITYGASRTAETGHADIAWSIMHGLYIERFQHSTTAANSGGGGFISASG